MANIVKDNLEESSAETIYYLFRPDTIIKTIGDLTFLYNPILNEWTKTKSISSYIKSGIPFKILEEQTLKELINTLQENIFMKKEISNRDIEDFISGRKKIIDVAKHEDLYPELFEDKELEGINITKKTLNKFTPKLKYLIYLLGVVCIAIIVTAIFPEKKDNQIKLGCEPFLRTVNYTTNDELNKDFSYYSSCNDDSFKSLDFRNVDLTKPGVYLYTGIDKNGEEKTGTIIVK